MHITCPAVVDLFLVCFVRRREHNDQTGRVTVMKRGTIIRSWRSHQPRLSRARDTFEDYDMIVRDVRKQFNTI